MYIERCWVVKDVFFFLRVFNIRNFSGEMIVWLFENNIDKFLGCYVGEIF